ncbi:MAG: hypothetical protein HQM08_15090 [Candidatus Riflebacteria bacterium]|nr:hypothetical protein [Candidatus Riflebacteria bacterium]
MSRRVALGLVFFLLFGVGYSIWRLSQYDSLIAEVLVNFGGEPRVQFESLVRLESHAGIKAFASALNGLGGYKPDVSALLREWSEPGKILTADALRRLFAGKPTYLPLRFFRSSAEVVQEYLKSSTGTPPGGSQEPVIRFLVALIVGLEQSDRAVINHLLAISIRAQTVEVLAEMFKRKALREFDRQLFLRLWKEASVERPTLAQAWKSEEKSFELLVQQVRRKAPLATALHRLLSGSPERQYLELLAKWETITPGELNQKLGGTHPIVKAAFPNVVKTREEVQSYQKRESAALAALGETDSASRSPR